MGHYFILPKKDSTIYNDNPTENCGLDSIIELEKQLIEDIPRNSRILMQFELDDFSASFASGEMSGSEMKFYLNINVSEAWEIPLSYTIYAHPLTNNWENGTGKRNMTPITTDGVSWNLRDGITTTGISGSGWNTPGGDFSSGSQYDVSQSFDTQTSDIYMDISNIIMAWMSGSLTNYGLIIKRSDADESSSLDSGNFQFFSKETHTIYKPKLEVVWKDTLFDFPTETSESYTTNTTETTRSFNIPTLYFTESFRTDSLNDHYYTQSDDHNTWISKSITPITGAIFELNGSGIYASESEYNITVSYTYYSESNIAVSTSILDIITDTFYTGTLGANLIDWGGLGLIISGSTGSYIWRYCDPIASPFFTWSVDHTTQFDIWILDQHGVYNSQSYSASATSFVYTSQSITGYDTQSFSLSLLDPIDKDDFIIVLQNLQTEYQQDTKTKFRLWARDRFPIKTYTTESWWYEENLKPLPTESYYCIKDAFTEDEIIPFSEYSQLSGDISGSFFDLYFNEWEPERFYRILIKTKLNSFEKIFDKNYTFKIIR